MTRVFKAKRRPPRKKPVTKAVKRYVRKANLRQGEVKYITNEGTYSATYSSAVPSTPLYNMIAGDGVGERNALKVRPTNVNIRFTAYRGLTDCHLRLVVFRYTDNVTGPVNNNFVLDTLGTAGTSNWINAPRIIAKGNRMTEILYDRSWLLDDGRQNGIKKNINIKTGGKPVYYTVNTSTGVRKNEIYYFFMTDTSLANQPLLDFITISRYRDV